MKELKIDLDGLTLDDLIRLEEAPTLSFRAARDLLASVIDGWTVEDAGALSLRELAEVNRAIGKAIEEYKAELIPPENSGG